jgi:hypothetical protein
MAHELDAVAKACVGTDVAERPDAHARTEPRTLLHDRIGVNFRL